MGRQAVADGGIFRFYFLILWRLRPAGTGGKIIMNEKLQKSMTTADGWIEQWGLGGRMSKFRVQEAAQALRADAGAVREWAAVARHTADGRVATNILRVLSYLPVAVKRSVLGTTYDEWADWAMRPNLPVRRALVLALLVDLHEPGRWRPDLLNYAMLHATDAAVDCSTRAYLIKLMAVMCRSYPDLAREVETFLDVLPPDAPPSLRAARRQALRLLRPRSRRNGRSE